MSEERLSRSWKACMTWWSSDTARLTWTIPQPVISLLIARKLNCRQMGASPLLFPGHGRRKFLIDILSITRTSVQGPGKRADDGPYFTNSEGTSHFRTARKARRRVECRWYLIRFCFRSSSTLIGLRIWKEWFILVCLRFLWLLSWKMDVDYHRRQRCLWILWSDQGYVTSNQGTVYAFTICLRSHFLTLQANFLKSSGLKTPVFVRFSTVTLGREFPRPGQESQRFRN